MTIEVQPVPEVVLASEFPSLADRPAGTYNAKAAAWAASENAMAESVREIALVTKHNAEAAQEAAETLADPAVQEVVENLPAIVAVNANRQNINTVAANAANINAVHANKANIDAAAANMPAILAAPSYATAASNSATQAGNQASASMSAAQAANAALLALGNALVNGIGAFFVDGDGNLIAEYNAPTVTGMAIDGNGNLLVTY